ncbi:hypothetical protein QQY24_11070 [Streptomyces sp. TG1A-8]|uniref:DUF6542 domain-containing protein n=1 Tax=Streptomyces sp. TG1A-8 TaxID=3051385 RepID=UPI00265C1299|nr:DUF6542 domain-containing protein [Streptomyces sp. TG1A-8]MDO0925938.1 hypothetical protein [Streptomyces sp. TG1A-8]
MEQRRTRPSHHGPRRGTPPASLPPQARRRTAAERGPAPGAGGSARAVRLSRPVPPLPGLRLTGLGGSLFCVALMVLLGWLDHVLFGASAAVYGVLFLPVCLLTALWVRDGDVLTAPVAVPIAFAAGLFPVADTGGGLLGRLMALFTGLATQAGWLYAGTLATGAIVLVRRVRWVRRRRGA